MDERWREELELARDVLASVLASGDGPQLVADRVSAVFRAVLRAMVSLGFERSWVEREVACVGTGGVVIGRFLIVLAGFLYVVVGAWVIAQPVVPFWAAVVLGAVLILVGIWAVAALL